MYWHIGHPFFLIYLLDIDANLFPVASNNVGDDYWHQQKPDFSKRLADEYHNLAVLSHFIPLDCNTNIAC